MTASPRYLTKSRFKLALECPTKLAYTGRPDCADISADNSFLASLAEGGYQVGALACLMYPGGVEVREQGHEAQVERTRDLLQRDEVTIYEAAFQVKGLFVLVDILRKRDGVIELIEVKARSYHPVRDADLRNTRGEISSGYLPYLQDIAFQRHVVAMALPGAALRCFLMMADTSRVATVDGLNQRFRIRREGNRVAVTVDPTLAPGDLGEPILAAVPVDDQVAEILGGTLPLPAGDLPFAEAVEHLARAWAEDRMIPPAIGTQCGTCQFRTEFPPAGKTALRSGLHECWKSALGWTDADFAGGTVLDLWNFRGKARLLAQGVHRLSEVQEVDLGGPLDEPGLAGMRAAHRQWYQCGGRWPGGGEFNLNRAGLAEAMRTWRYPLHFIDFETSAVPIPFSAGKRPYQTTAFQFSHHVLHADGRLVHQTQFLLAAPGVDPTVPFVRALKGALSNDLGSVFRWATHENSVLNQVRNQLLEDPSAPADRDELVEFIESITARRDEGVELIGPRSMIDLCALAERHFFHPMTAGSSSLKKVLPALMKASTYLRDLYGQPAHGHLLYGSAAMPSLNLREPIAWWREVDGVVCDPYRLLPPVFADLAADEQAAAEAGLVGELKDGGAAMAAFARLQSEDLAPAHRQAIEASLLRYCELDTLAMVMAVQAWQDWLGRAPPVPSG